jgi:hypothetical protein
MYRFLPWKFIVKRAARAYGILDPALWLARVRQFSQPSEVQEPIELLRAGVLFHARGIVNVKAIQHNLDWVWPYWVERQFDPGDVSFIPRAFSFSHVNLTHRNWTAIGLPELSIYPIVDPRGLLTPLQDGWSIDCWLFDKAGRACLPSRAKDDQARQQLLVSGDLAVVTTVREGVMAITQTARVVAVRGTDGEAPEVELKVRATSPGGGRLVVAIRPYNPEGVQFIDHVAVRPERDGWTVNDRLDVVIDKPADAVLTSDYAGGDVYSQLVPNSSEAEPPDARSPHPPGDVHCATGMATAASIYQLHGDAIELTVRVPLAKELAALGNPQRFHERGGAALRDWSSVDATTATLRIPDPHMQFLYDAAIRTVTLLSADEIVPGPYTYRRFWFRDACIMMNAMLVVGMAKLCRRAIEQFPARQLRSGYFRSQEGEWDSNGQVLWILDRFETVTGESLGIAINDAAMKAVTWIAKKREPAAEGVLHAGLLPPGFSAEHLGPNDYYYWDDYWAVAGLQAAERLFLRAGRAATAASPRREADDMLAAIERSVRAIPRRRSLGGIPASPYRRLDSGAVGSLVADYPLQLTPAGDARIMATVEGLLRTSFHNGGFFQEIIHSGINAYLTLDVAQTLLRAGDARYRQLVETVAAIASPTGQWPEAIHPHSGGGCMGDGQHGWAAAEWLMMMRNMFVREEGDRLVVGSGVFAEWIDELESGADLYFGPTATPWGPVSVKIARDGDDSLVTVTGTWRRTAPRIDVFLPSWGAALDVAAGEPSRIARGARAEWNDGEPAHGAAARVERMTP